MDNIIYVGAGAVIIKDNQTLLTKRIGAHGENSYGSFGGHVEFGETPVKPQFVKHAKNLVLKLGIYNLFPALILLNTKNIISISHLSRI